MSTESTGDAPGRTALVLGATGLIGGLCLERLLADGAWSRVTAVVRRPTGRSGLTLGDAPVGRRGHRGHRRTDRGVCRRRRVARVGEPFRPPHIGGAREAC